MQISITIILIYLLKKQSVKVNMPAHWDIWFKALWWDCIGSPWDDPRWEDVAAPLTCRHWQNVCTCTSFGHQQAVNQQHGTQVQLWRFLTTTYAIGTELPSLLSLLLRLSWGDSINSRNLYHCDCHASLSLFTLHSMSMCCFCLPVQS
jgi:hypothetical protein